MIDGDSTKLGDIVRAMNGKTIEVLNSDAEGRLILSDALTYAVNCGADEIIDLATLTGACKVALGNSFSGVMSNNQLLADRFIEAGNETGELMWQLPLHDDYRNEIKSKVADIKNVGSKGGAGAQIGAVFLEHFVDKKPWLHIDIAGTAWIDKANEFGPEGPTGVGTRALINYITKYA